MTLPASIRVNVRSPFPSRVQGASFIQVAKANGIWTLSPNYTLLAPSVGLDGTQILAVYDTVAKTWSTISALSLLAAQSIYREVAGGVTINVQPSDVSLLITGTPGSPTTIQLPNSATRGGLPVYVKDLTYLAATQNINFAPAVGETFDGFSASAAITNGVAVISIDGGDKTMFPLTSGGWFVKS
jgi:hypothetical protein